MIEQLKQSSKPYKLKRFAFAEHFKQTFLQTESSGNVWKPIQCVQPLFKRGGGIPIPPVFSNWRRCDNRPAVVVVSGRVADNNIDCQWFHQQRWANVDSRLNPACETTCHQLSVHHHRLGKEWNEMKFARRRKTDDGRDMAPSARVSHIFGSSVL